MSDNVSTEVICCWGQRKFFQNHTSTVVSCHCRIISNENLVRCTTMVESSLRFLYCLDFMFRVNKWLRELISRFRFKKQVTEDANFEEVLKLQRGDVVVLVLAVLEKFGLSLSYVEARKMTTCSELIDYIESQVRQDDSSNNEDHWQTEIVACKNCSKPRISLHISE